MIETTINSLARSLDKAVSISARRDEQWHIFKEAADISPPVNGVPQPNRAEPVAILISARRYRWLVDRSAELDRLTRAA